MERVRHLRDAIKNRYSKPCCIKVGVGIGVALLLVVVVVVAATVAGGGRDGNDEGTTEEAGQGGSPNGGNGDSETPGPNPPLPREVKWAHQFTVQLESQGFSQILAIDDSSQKYLIEINNNRNFNVYIIVDFPARQHYYVIIHKGNGDDLTNMAEKNVLYCESSSFASDFNGRFTSSSILKEGGSTYREQVSGRTATLDAAYVNAPYSVIPTLVAVLNGTCDSLPLDQRFQWNSNLSVCGNNTTAPSDSLDCSNDPCPVFPATSGSVTQACGDFQKCNYVMSKCDSSWTTPYDARPYCVCRKTLLKNMDSVDCSTTQHEDGDGDCQTSKRNIEELESTYPCYCRYRISRIYPKVIPTNIQTIGWEIRAAILTAPSLNFNQCPC